MTKTTTRIAEITLLENGKWEVTANKSHGGRRTVKSTAASAFKYVESRLKRSAAGVSSLVIVDYGEGYSNESTETQNTAQNLYALACFLEDYLKPDFLTNRTAKYLREMKNYDTV